MPIAQVLLTDTFDQWRQKTNSMIDTVNSLGAAGDIMSVTGAVAGHMLLYNGTSFQNVPMSGDATINSSGVITVTGGAGGTTKGRIRFAGCISSLF